MNAASPRAVVVMGVSGVGKTALGSALASTLGWDFQEGDDLHPAENIAKMASGRPLTDADRMPWLDRVASVIGATLAHGHSIVISCSALKRTYRDRLRQGHAASEIVIVCIRADRQLLENRLRSRTNHFMPAALLASQFADLEYPAPDEQPIFVSAEDDIEHQVSCIVRALGQRAMRERDVP